MQSTQLGYGLQIFGQVAKLPTLNKSINLALIESLLSVIFIVMALAAVTALAVNLSGSVSVSVPAQQEKTAYLPGQYITQQLNDGYIGL